MRLHAKDVITALIITTSLGGCVPSKRSRVQSIVGADDRQLVDDVISSAAIGTLHISDGSALCTAFASSPDEVITAAHCLKNNIGDGDYRFHTKKTGFRKLDRVILRGGDSDIVVFKAAQPTATYLSLATTAPDHSSAQLIGFDFKALSLMGTSQGDINLANGGLVTHTFDTLPGQSGSPIIQSGKVVAVHIGSSKTANANIAVGSLSLSTAKVKASYPDFVPEHPVLIAIEEAAIICRASIICTAIVAKIAEKTYENTTALVVNYIEKRKAEELARKQQALAQQKEDQAYRDQALSRDNPHNQSPGGWAGGDFGHGAGDRGSVLALLDARSDFIHEMGIYLGAAIEIIYVEAFHREANAEEFNVMGAHIQNGASYGFLKATVFNTVPINERHGNNGTVSCDTFCADRRFTNAPGSCVSAKISTTGRGVMCSATPGFVDGGELSCHCLSDGFSKPGNNGTVSCRDFCWGRQWGDIGNCLGAYQGNAISCDVVTGNPQDCVCGGFGQH